MSDHVLLGGGALAREIVDWFTPSFATDGHRFAGYVDDGDAPMEPYGFDLQQLGGFADYVPASDSRVVLAVGSPAGKRAISERLDRGRFATLVHPTAQISRSARLGVGVLIGPFVMVSANAVVEDFAVVNAYSSVGHDATLGAYSTLSCHCDLTGRVKVGPHCFFGSGARALPDVAIGEGCIIGAGAVVVRSTPSQGTYYAAPARRL